MKRAMSRRVEPLDFGVLRLARSSNACGPAPHQIQTFGFFEELGGGAGLPPRCKSAAAILGDLPYALAPISSTLALCRVPISTRSASGNRPRLDHLDISSTVLWLLSRWRSTLSWWSVRAGAAVAVSGAALSPLAATVSEPGHRGLNFIAARRRAFGYCVVNHQHTLGIA
ncbi:MAG: hypothetical protein IPK48_08420 [Gammaproteobacteria bacterium]|nr:hypothetical protein [Gammaproteobacteria bacterium]